MNLHDNEFDPSLQELEAQLSQWKVAPPTIDPQVLFYQAGFAAASVQHQPRVWNQRLVTAATLLLAIGFSSLISYRAGQSSVVVAPTQIAAKTPSQPEQSDAPTNRQVEASGPISLVNATPVDVGASAPVPMQNLVTRWLQNKLPLNNSHDRDLLAASDPNRQLDQAGFARDSASASMSEPFVLDEMLDSPEYALLKRERALRSQRLINWLPTL